MTRKTVRYEFDVAGRGTFPIDMLRYDACFPAGEDDAHRIEASFMEAGTSKLRTIRLRMAINNCLPTVARWGSTLWVVVEGSVTKIAPL